MSSDLPYATDVGRSFTQLTKGTHYKPFDISSIKARGPYTSASTPSTSATADGPRAVITDQGPYYGPFKIKAEAAIESPSKQPAIADYSFTATSDGTVGQASAWDPTAHYTNTRTNHLLTIFDLCPFSHPRPPVARPRSRWWTPSS